MVIETEGTAAKPARPSVIRTSETTLEVESDSGEGAQKCGQIFGSVRAETGNGAWTVEIIPAEIRPPQRAPAGGSGNRIRFGAGEITNWGDTSNLIVAFNEQVLLGRIQLGALADDAIILLENMWATHSDADVRSEWYSGIEQVRASGSYRIIEVPMEEECLQVVGDTSRGENMLVLGLLTWIYDRDVELTKAQSAHRFRSKSNDVYDRNVKLHELGRLWAQEKLDFRIEVPIVQPEVPRVVMNGNEAIGIGGMAAGIQLCSMYPITPATAEAGVPPQGFFFRENPAALPH